MEFVLGAFVFLAGVIVGSAIVITSYSRSDDE